MLEVSRDVGGGFDKRWMVAERMNEEERMGILNERGRSYGDPRADAHTMRSFPRGRVGALVPRELRWAASGINIGHRLEGIGLFPRRFRDIFLGGV
jgi:hypothetical protein